MTRLSVVIALGIVLLAVNPANAALVQWSGNGHWYEPVPGTITWTDAKAAAEAQGGYLATITSADENAFVAGIVAFPEYWHGYSPAVGPWIGAFQPAGSQEPAGGWQWVTGEQWNYTNWWPGEPNNGAGATPENVISFWIWNTHPNQSIYGNSWNDQPSVYANPSGYVIEYTVVPEPSTFALLGAGAVGLLGWAWRRK